MFCIPSLTSKELFQFPIDQISNMIKSVENECNQMKREAIISENKIKDQFHKLAENVSDQNRMLFENMKNEIESEVKSEIKEIKDIIMTEVCNHINSVENKIKDINSKMDKLIELFERSSMIHIQKEVQEIALQVQEDIQEIAIQEEEVQEVAIQVVEEEIIEKNDVKKKRNYNRKKKE